MNGATSTNTLYSLTEVLYIYIFSKFNLYTIKNNIDIITVNFDISSKKFINIVKGINKESNSFNLVIGKLHIYNIIYISQNNGTWLK